MFQLFKKKKGNEIGAVVSGTYKPLKDVNDAVFSQGLIGRGIAILADDNTICAPVDGILSVVFPTGHAFGIKMEDGLELLIHIGIDTVNLNGKGFELLVKQGMHVEKGTPLVNVDFPFLKQQGYECETMLLVTTPQEKCSFQIMVEDGAKVACGQTLFICEKH